MKADQGRPWDFPAKTPSTESRHEKIPRTGAVSVPHSSFAQRAAPLARYSLPSGQVPPFRPNRQLVSSCIAESTLGTRNRQTRRADPGLWGGPHHNNEPAPDPHLRQATLENVTTLIDSRLRDEDPRAKAVGVVPVVLTRTTTDELDPTPPHSPRETTTTNPTRTRHTCGKPPQGTS